MRVFSIFAKDLMGSMCQVGGSEGDGVEKHEGDNCRSKGIDPDSRRRDC